MNAQCGKGGKKLYFATFSETFDRLLFAVNSSPYSEHARSAGRASQLHREAHGFESVERFLGFLKIAFLNLI